MEKYVWVGLLVVLLVGSFVSADVYYSCGGCRFEIGDDFCWEDICGGGIFDDRCLPIDFDGDGYDEYEDCDDGDADVNPGAIEVCGNGVDEDCDGVDLECPVIACSKDLDCGVPSCGGGVNYCFGGDVFQDYDVPVCENAGEFNSYCSSYVESWLIEDCDWGCLFGSCVGELDDDLDDDGYDNVTDCDDGNALINPGADEVCGNGVDEDCDGVDGVCGDDEDVTAPGAISDLVAVDVDEDSISWEWVNPVDEDFSLCLVYFDGVNVLNSSEEGYEVGGLEDDEEYEIVVYTMDDSGNVNWDGVSDVVRTLAEEEDNDDSSRRYVLINRGSSEEEESVNYFVESDVVESELIEIVVLNDGFVEGDDEDSDLWLFVFVLLIIGILVLLGMIVFVGGK